ncbi:MAG: hypothetical protein NTZ56_03845 [Acidobacteria bacterium]|nr:hypothetical protein [Acidobacteriota bacterium]
MSARIQQRFWVEREGSLDLSDQGFLVDSGSETAASSFESLAGTPCWVLLGEPGMGKSTVLRGECERTHAALSDEDQTHFIDLAAHSSDVGLRAALTGSPQWAAWRDSQSILYLHLDALDEGRLFVSNIANILLDVLRNVPIERLFLRISCRTAEWPRLLDEELPKRYGEELVRVVELAPLRRRDVVAEAVDAGLDEAAFVERVVEQDAVPLAIRPITLKFLINSFRFGNWPTSRTQLYETGCTQLAEETSNTRRGAGRTGGHLPVERVELAARVAAATILANRPAVWLGSLAEKAFDDLSIDDLVADGITAEGIRETLNTGLFSARGANRLAWSHQTYGEFLAARFLAQSGLSVPQILAVVMHPGVPGKVVPQLRPTVAWLAGMNVEVLRAVAKSDPEVLLQSDAATFKSSDRQLLVKCLLDSCAREELTDWGWGWRTYAQLGYPEMAVDLRPLIVDKDQGDRGLIVRRVAIDMAEANELTELEQDLLSVALDPTDLHHVRVQAIHALKKVGSASARAQLRPLAMAEQPVLGDDANHELRGSALRACWPEYLSSAELFVAISEPSNPSHIGSYDMFIRSEVLPGLSQADLPMALEWAFIHAASLSGIGPTKDLVRDVLSLAIERIHADGVLGGLARFFQRQLQHGRPLDPLGDERRITGQLCTSPDRLRLIEAILAMEGTGDGTMSSIRHTGLAWPSDIPRLVATQLDDLQPESSKRRARLIRLLIDPRDVAALDCVLTAAGTNCFLHEEMTPLIGPVQLDSAEARELRKHYEEIVQAASGTVIALLDPPPHVLVEGALQGCEADAPDAFSRLVHYLSLEPTGPSNKHFYSPDIPDFPGWVAADESTRHRILLAASHYLLGFKDDGAWIILNGSSRDKTYPHSVFSAFRALRLLQRSAPAILQELPKRVWETCSPSILGFPLDKVEDPDRALVAHALQQAPTAFRTMLRTVLVIESLSPYGMNVLRRLEEAIDEGIDALLKDIARSSNVSPVALGQILTGLTGRPSSMGVALAQEIFAATAGDPTSNASPVAASHLALYGSASDWELIWTAIQSDAKLGMRIFLHAGWPGHLEGLSPHLSELQLANLFLWMMQRVPTHDDIPLNGVVNSQHVLQGWRGRVLNQLTRMGTLEACEQIRRIVAELPNDAGHLKFSLLEAEERMKTQTWTPVQASEIFKVVKDAQWRLVRNGEHLLDVLIESLDRLQIHLQGDTPAAVDLWNKFETGVYRPKEEVELSDYIARHFRIELTERGIIIGREVEIRRGTGGAPGERTDIRVDAIRTQLRHDGLDRVSVIVEVKGSWNRGVFTDMEGQLVKRYLKQDCRHGLYVVGWFNCPQWDTKDSRQRASAAHGLDSTRGKLDSQARQLSSGTMIVRSVVLDASLH